MEQKDRLAALLRPTLSTMLFLGLSLLIAALFFLGSAQPQPETFLDRHWEAAVRRSWDLSRIQQGRQILLMNLGLCALAIPLAGLDSGERGVSRRRAFGAILGLSGLALLIAGRLG